MTGQKNGDGTKKLDQPKTGLAWRDWGLVLLFNQIHEFSKNPNSLEQAMIYNAARSGAKDRLRWKAANGWQIHQIAGWNCVILDPKGKGEKMKFTQKHVQRILAGLKATYPKAHCALAHHDPLELLVATILSAQCTDERVNQVTPDLFRKFSSAEDFAQASIADLEGMVRSTGFFRNKAKNIKAACQRIVSEHDGKVPATMEELIQLPGVARKTANVVLGTAYGIASGIVVDTHVFRLSHRLGLSRAPTPERVELDLLNWIPTKEWIDFSHRLIQHGRRVCSARKPRCSECVLTEICPKVDVEIAKGNEKGRRTEQS